jgi:hypothetical protein
MGLKDWFAGNVAGPKSRGNALGRSAREGGSALGNAMFSSHGSKPGNGPIAIFDTLSDMQSAGFDPFSETPRPIEYGATRQRFPVIRESQRDSNHSAQGCEARATLGQPSKTTNPERVASSLRRGLVQPLQG